MKVLVTGAAGLYGVHVVDELVNSLAVEKVIGIDNFSRKYLQHSPFFQSEHLDEKFISLQGRFQDISAEMLDKEEIDVVVHLAAYVSVPESMTAAGRIKYIENNEWGTIQLMETLMSTDRKPVLIFASSGAVYGPPKECPITTSHPKNPSSVYGLTKRGAEDYCMLMYNKFGYPVTVFRNFNTYGPNQNLHLEDAAVIPKFIQSALTGQPLSVHSDGLQARDFLYAKDAAVAYAAACHQGPALAGRVFHMSTGIPTTINDLAATIIDLTGSKSDIVHAKIRADAPSYVQCASNIETKEALNWDCAHTVREGLEHCISWYAKALAIEPLLEDPNNGLFNRPNYSLLI